MKFKRGRTSRAVAYLMSAVMISQALLSPVSTVYASAVDGAASQQVAAETEEGNVGSSDGSSNGQDTGTDDTTVTDDTGSSHTSASADNAAEQSEVASTPANDAAEQSEVASRSVDGYNPNAEPIVIDSNTIPGSASVTVGFYKDKDYTQELGTEALGVHQTVYGKVNIQFNGSLKPTTANPNFKYVFPDKIHVADNSGTNVVDGQTMYTWSISGNEFIVKFTEAFFESHSSEIFTNAKFEFTLDSDQIGDDGKLDVVFPGTDSTVTFTQKEGNVSGNKTCQLSADGKTVSYTIDLNPETNITDFKLVDTLGDNLSFKGDFMLDGQKVTSAINGQTATITLDKLSKGEHKITYTAEVKQDAFDALKPGANGDAALDSVGNKAKWSWAGNPSGNTSETTPSIKYDLLGGKSATSNKDGAYEWTVNINTGSLKASMDGYTFKDELQKPEGMQYTGNYKVIDVTDGNKEVASGELDSSKASFDYTFGNDAKAHEYKIVYCTTMKGGAAFGEYKNYATITDGKENSDKASSSVNHRPGTSADIKKEQTSAIDADGYVTWKVTIGLSKLASGCDITKAMFTDVPGFGYSVGTQSKDNIWFPDNGDLTLTTSTDKMLKAGKDYKASWANNKSEWSSDAQEPEDKNWGLKIAFTKEMQQFVGNTDVVLTYRTKCSGAEGTYKNSAVFKDGYGNTPSDEKSYEIKSMQSTTKKAENNSSLAWDPNFDWSTISASDTTKGAWVATWTVKANYEESDKTSYTKYGLNDTGGNPIDIEDDLAGMTYVPGSGSYTVKANYGNSDKGENCLSAGKLEVLNPQLVDGKLKVSIPTANVFDGKGEGTHYVWAEVKYQTAVKATTEQKDLSFTNKVSSGTGSDSYGSATATVTGKQTIVDKSARYESKNNLVAYSINVNDQAQDLISGSDVVTLSDTLTGKADFVLDSISVVDAQTNVKLTADEYAYSIEQGTSEDGKPTTTLTFTLPDSRALKVSYKVVISGEIGETGELSNQAVLAGKEGWSSSNKVPYTVAKSDVDAGGIATSISIQKVDGSAPTTPLSGATFKLYKVADLDALASGSAEDIQKAGKLVSTETSDDMGKIVFGGEGDQELETSVLYYFKETASPTGFIKNGDITCVVLKGNDEDAFNKVIAKLKEKGVNYETKASYVRYNTPTSNAQAEFKAKKVMTGDKTSLADGEFSFVAKDAAGNEVARGVNDANGNVTITGDKLSWDQPGTYTYTISEKQGSAKGVTYSTVKYEAVVTVERQGTYGPLKATVAYQEGDTPLDTGTLPTFINTYKTTSSSTEATLSVKKTVNGGSEIAADRDFSFSLYRAGADGKAAGDALATASAKPGETAKFSELSFDKAGTYQYVIAEDGELGGGWTKAEPVIATVTVEAAGDGALSVKSVTYSNGDDAALFDNTYEARGSATVKIKKTVNGEAPLKGESFEFSATAEGENAADAPKLANVVTGKDGKAAFAVAELSDRDAGKTYTYRIHEVTDPAGGSGTWAKAADVIATVKVGKRSGDNKLTASVTYRMDKDGAEPYEGTAQFNNAFKPAAVTAPIKVAKASVNGKTDFKADEDYTFGLYARGEDGQRAGTALATVATKLGETKVFDAQALSYDKPGTYEYLVHEETHNGEAGWSAVADVPVTVTVARKGGSGSDARDFKATVAYGGSASVDHASFADTYTAAGAATLKVSKLVNGGKDKAEDESFDFVLKDAEGKELSRTTAKAGKTAAFAPIDYKLADAGKTFTYTIAEAGHNSGSWFKAADVTATVQVSDNGDGTLKTEVSYSNTDGEKAAALFDNTHAAPVTAELGVSKTINGSKEDAAKEQFSFALTANGDAPMPISSTVTVDGTGTGSFGKISYREPGTYTYTIREASNLGAGWTNADDVTATVTVARDEDAKSLKVTGIEYSRATADKSAAAFDNTYRAKSTEVSLKAFKTLRGAELKADQFEFQLKDAAGKVLQTVRNDKDGNVAFDALSYKESDLSGRGASHDFEYTISEVVPEDAIDGVKDGVAYDVTEHKVKVHVSDDGKSGQLAATVTYDGKSVVPTFTNAVVKTEPVKVSLSAKKLVNGEAPSAAQKFSFDLNKSDASGTKGELVESVQNQGGEVSFKALEYGDVADEWYTISEKAAEGFDCDKKNVKVHVSVTKGADGKLSSQVMYVDGDVKSDEPATFRNQVAPVSAQLAVKKTVNGGSAIAAGRDFSFSLYKAGEDGKATGDALATASVKPGKTAEFDALSFDKAGTYQYVIAEDGELGGGWTKAEPVIATVTVEAVGNGALSVKSVKYSNGKNAALFDNAYAASGSASVSVAKTVNGAAPADEQEFAFELKPVDGAPMPDGAASLTATTKGADAASFPKLAYSLKDAGKTYTYRIRETTPATVGWTMADDVTVTVTVGADLGDGTLGAATIAYSNGSDAALFNNKYEQAAGEFQLGLVKTVNGEAPLKGESFEFSATAEGDNAASAPKLENVTTEGDGNATFAAAKLSDKDAGKTYTYRIHEVTDPAGGDGTWTKAADVIATVKVSEHSGDNKLTASVTYHVDGSAQTYEGTANFDNTFKPSAAVASIAAGKKSVNGATDVKAGEDYTFVLYAKGEDGQRAGKALATVATKLGETKVFDAQALSYDKPGTYEYLVHEENHNGEAGWSAVADVPVTVTVAPKGGSGADARDLVATVAYGGKANADAALFADTYAATGEAKLSVSKKVTGKADAVKDEAFAFELKDAKGTVLSAATAKAGETADFAPIAYDLADAGKTFEYTIHEVGHGSGAWFKPGDVKVTVAVSDKGNGQLAAKVTYDRANGDGTAALFENVYQPASAALKVTKTINGATEDNAAEEFAFELSARDGAPLPASTTLTVKGTSTGSFDKIRYTEPGTYRYSIHETSDLGVGWANAGDVEATVTVERDEAARSLKVTKVEYSNANADAAAALFDNRYDAKDVKVALGATKTLSGATLKADQFEFVLRDADGNEVARAKNAADGAIAFPELAYSLDQIGGRGKSKTFEYTIEEVAGSEDGVTYDKAVHKVKVVVSDDGASGKLIAEVAYDGAASAPVFENAYTPHTPKDSPKKPGGMPSTGDNSSMLASFVATMGLVALATGLRMSRRKRD